MEEIHLLIQGKCPHENKKTRPHGRVRIVHLRSLRMVSFYGYAGRLLLGYRSWFCFNDAILKGNRIKGVSRSSFF